MVRTEWCQALELLTRAWASTLLAGPYLCHMDLQSVHIKRFLLVSRAEGASFLLLLFIAMPLKYFAGMPEAVKYVGWAHGLLFILYMLQLALVAFSQKWDVLKVLFGFAASLVPFGPFLFERRLKTA